MEDQANHNEHIVPRLVSKFFEELEIGLKPFDDKDKIEVLEHIIIFAQGISDGQDDYRLLNENSFHWILKTYRKQAKQLYDFYLQDYFFNGSIKFFPDLKTADDPESWIGLQLGETAFDFYLLELTIRIRTLCDEFYLMVEPEKVEQEEVKVAYLSLKRVALYYYYLNEAYKICEDNTQLARMASKVSGHGEANLYKKICYPLGKDLEKGQSLNHLRADILAVRKVFEDAGMELTFKGIDRDLRDIDRVDKGKE